MHAPISFSIVKKLRSYNEIANLTTLKPEESSVTIHVEHKMVTVFQCPDKQQKVYA